MNIRIATYNIKGFKPRNYEFVTKISKDCEVFLIQETWLYNYEIKYIQQVLSTSNIFMKSSMNEGIIDRQGKPFGGCAIAISNSLNFDAQMVDTISNRLF